MKIKMLLPSVSSSVVSPIITFSVRSIVLGGPLGSLKCVLHSTAARHKTDWF